MTSLAKEKKVELLKTVFMKRNPDLLRLLEKSTVETLSDGERNQLQIAIGEELASFGTDPAGEITAYGIQLDDLISFVSKL